MADYLSLDLGSTKPISVPTEVVEVEIDPTVMVDDFSKALSSEIVRLNPRRAEQVGLTEDELINYDRYLLKQRVATVSNSCKDWRLLKNLYIPDWIQFSLSNIGRVLDPERGLEFVPVCNFKLDFTIDDALEVSHKLHYFVDDIRLSLDAMPRSIDGNYDVMSDAIINGYLRSTHKNEHPVFTYVAAFMGFKLKKDNALAALYRTQYDDLQYIATALLHHNIYSA